MGENIKTNQRCIKGNTAYFKIKIDEMINYEINKIGADQASYLKFNAKISNKFAEFSEKMISGGEFNQAITNLRDEVIAECVETDNKSATKMRPFFKDYIFDKIYTMGINIKKGMLPEDCEQELEEARLKQEEENKLKEEQEKEEQEKAANEITVTVEDSEEEKQPDVIDLMWSYFFGGPKASSSKTDKKPENKKEEKEQDANKVKGE